MDLLHQALDILKLVANYFHAFSSWCLELLWCYNLKWRSLIMMLILLRLLLVFSAINLTNFGSFWQFLYFSWTTWLKEFPELIEFHNSKKVILMYFFETNFTWKLSECKFGYPWKKSAYVYRIWSTFNWKIYISF